MGGKTSEGAREAAVWRALRTVKDPELPFLSVVDLGVLREVRVEGERVEVTITPTYSGCPALEVIEEEVDRALAEAGFSARALQRVYAPAWTTDWITEEGRRLLFEHGVAPPGAAGGGLVPLRVPVPCPRCGAKDTEELSRFGSTACKALYRCRACQEPFDHVKAI